MDYARNLLDKLMGPERNQNNRKKLNYWDQMVCKNYIVDFCPHDLFVNTKSDLGPCTKVHDDNLKAEYEAAQKGESQNLPPGGLPNYEHHLYLACERLVRDLDRKIRKANERLTQKGDANIERINQITRDERTERMVVFEEKIKELQEKMENCAMEGLVDEAKDLMRQVETYQSQLEALKQEELMEKKMETCEVCGALLVINDVTDRVTSHLEGKQHNGYIKLRQKYEELKAKYAPARDHEYPSHSSGSNSMRRDGQSHDESYRRDYSDRSYPRNDRPPYSDNNYRSDYNRPPRDGGSTYHSDRRAQPYPGGYNSSSGPSRRDFGPPPPGGPDRHSRQYQDGRSQGPRGYDSSDRRNDRDHYDSRSKGSRY
ncbi:hypothetical protein MP638_007354 [Amoeboaphelidium occidentale]|nr:hypothetical protein MP638_007354 [Amoeboaphelidium occidentale]